MDASVATDRCTACGHLWRQHQVEGYGMFGIPLYPCFAAACACKGYVSPLPSPTPSRRLRP